MDDDTWVTPPPAPEPEPVKPKRITPEQRALRAKNKVKRGAHITATQLANELNVSPRVIRAHLRAMHLSKPEHGWAWPPGEAKTIAAKIKKRLRQQVGEGTPVEEPFTIDPPSNIVELHGDQIKIAS